ncbi:MAG: penicillin-binding transpeptidase domain-containing protein [Verrucomicrobiales bacterium]
MKIASLCQLCLVHLAILCSNQAGADELPAERGEIRDRHGVVLVENDADGGRNYPFGAAAAHLIGHKSCGGIEQSQDARLAAGEDITLTIDIRAQLAAELAMRRVGRGASVVIEPSTGEILAMVSVPSFDPSQFFPRLSKENFTSLQGDENKPLFNRCFGEYPPGSTFKIVTALTRRLDPVSADPQCYHCDSVLEIDGRRFRCWDRNGHGELDLQSALSRSCNVYFYRHGEAVGIAEIVRVARLFGLGTKPGLPVLTERSGTLPDPATHAERFGRAWGRGDTANAAIGQGVVTVSPVQMAGLVGAVGNGGRYVRPHLIASAKADPVDLVAEGISGERLAVVRAGMLDTVNGESGTATGARIRGLEIAGKTGTAQWGPNRGRLAWFVGYSPAENPRYAISVAVENGQSGGKVAAPLAAMILADCSALRPDPEKEQIKPLALEPAEGHAEPVTSIGKD